MQFAVNNLGCRVEATPGLKAVCPDCEEEVISKCGKLKIWHWSHGKDSECSQWYEPETEWHRNWKGLFSPSEREVVIERNGIRHRADIRLKNGIVIEFQHSPLSIDEIEKRENFYGGVIWVIDSSPFFDNFEVYNADSGQYNTFRWKHPRRSWCAAGAPIMIDFEDELFEIRKLHNDSRVGGWGYLRKKNQFIELIQKL